MSTNWFDTDRNRKLVPSRLCNDAELDALLDVIARYPHATFQVIARAATDRRRALEKACARGIRCLSLGDGVGGAKKEEGLDIWHLGGGNQPFQPMLGFEASIAAAAVPPWHEMINGPADDKLRKLADPEWRAAAREAWDNPLPEQNSFRAEQLDIFILTDSENGTGPVDISLKDLAEQRGVHPSDALADWVLANGIGSRYTKLSSTVVPLTDDQRREMMTASLNDPYAIVGGTDAGAHLTMFCGAGSNLYLLTHWARDEQAVSIEQAVHCMTQRSAEFFSLHDRGVIAVGKRADLTVFALDEIETRGFERRYDLPNDKYRLSRPSAGFRAVTVAGDPDRARRQAHRSAPHPTRQRPRYIRLLSFGVAPPTSDGAYRRQNGQVDNAQTSRSYCFAIGNRAITSAATHASSGAMRSRHFPDCSPAIRYVS